MKSPSPASLFTSNYVTYRRLWLDTLLKAFEREMRGLVLDMGGKRENKRGEFRPPEAAARAWWYLNLDLSTRPNIYADAGAVPLAPGSVDTILCTEVLEHLENPAACVREMERLLRPGGTAFVSVPFLYPVHADPYDFQRFTADGLKRYFSGFSDLQIWTMGGFWGVMGMFLEIGLPGIQGNSPGKKILRRALTWLARRLCAYDLSTLKHQPQAWQKFTSGYFLKATK